MRTTYRDRRGRLTTSTLSYTYLPDKRIARVVTRRKGDAEQLLAVYRYEKNGSYSIRTYLQRPGSPPHEGPWQRFDKTGKLLSRCSTGGVCSLYEYDARGTVRRVRLQMRGRHHYRRYLNEYDANGRLVRQKVGGEERRYRYNPRGELVEVTSRLAGELQSKSVRIYRYR